MGDTLIYTMGGPVRKPAPGAAKALPAPSFRCEGLASIPSVQGPGRYPTEGLSHLPRTLAPGPGSALLASVNGKACPCRRGWVARTTGCGTACGLLPYRRAWAPEAGDLRCKLGCARGASPRLHLGADGLLRKAPLGSSEGQKRRPVPFFFRSSRVRPAPAPMPQGRPWRTPLPGEPQFQRCHGYPQARQNGMGTGRPGLVWGAWFLELCRGTWPRRWVLSVRGQPRGLWPSPIDGRVRASPRSGEGRA